MYITDITHCAGIDELRSASPGPAGSPTASGIVTDGTANIARPNVRTALSC